MLGGLLGALARHSARTPNRAALHPWQSERCWSIVDQQAHSRQRACRNHSHHVNHEPDSSDAAAAAAMQTSQSAIVAGGATGAASSGTRAVAPRSRAKKVAPDPNQPTLHQVFARAAIKPAATAAAASAGGATASASAADAAPAAPLLSPTALPTSTRPHPALSSPRARARTSQPAASSASSSQPPPWSVEKEVILLRRTTPRAGSTAGTTLVTAATQGPYAGGPAGSAGFSSIPSLRDAQLSSRTTAGGDGASGAVTAGGSWGLQGGAGDGGDGAVFISSDDDVVVLAERVARIDLGSAAASAAKSRPADRAKAHPLLPASEEAAAGAVAYVGVHARDPAPGDPAPGDPAPGDLAPGDPAPGELPRPRVNSTAKAASRAAPAARTLEPALGEDCADDVVLAERPAARRRGAAAAAAAAASVGFETVDVAAAKPRAVRGKAKVKAARSGKAPGGALLWTELSAEERAAAGGVSWIRWEPLPPPADDGGGPAPHYHMFSVDIETVDFMRGMQAFPRPDQVRLLEVSAVDLGPYDQATAAADPRDGSEDRVFSTLVNCGRSFKKEKTLTHNGITWEESSAAGVPYTAQALERLFDFIQQRCSATAAAAEGGVSEPPSVVPLLMAHNGTGFDFPVLRSECGRVGVEWPQDWWYFDTLVAAKVLWAKADWPRKPAGQAEAAGVAEEAPEDEDEEGEGVEQGGGGKPSLSMDALKLWAGVRSQGKAHRAEVDALDLAGVWRMMWERFGRPSLGHLERLSSPRGATKSAAGPMHRLGLVSLAARADGLVRHMEAAVAPLLAPPPARSPAVGSQPSTRGLPAAAPAPSLVLTPDQLRELGESGRLHLRKAGGSGGGSFWVFDVMKERPAAVAASIGAPAAEAGPSQTSPRGQPPQPTLEPFVVLLRGVKMRYMARASYAYKDNHAPKWDMVLAAAGSGKTGSGGEGAAEVEEVSELVQLLDNLARQAAVLVRGDSASGPQLYSCGKDDVKTKKTGVSVQLHAQLALGPSPRQLRWEPLATLATYDKKASSYKSLQWPPLESYTPPAAGQAVGSRDAGGGGDGGQRGLDRIKEDNLARVVAQLPDVKSPEVLDVAVWPQFCWVNAKGCGVRLTAVHVVRRSGR